MSKVFSLTADTLFKLIGLYNRDDIYGAVIMA